MSRSEIQRQFDYAIRMIKKQGCPAYTPKTGCRYRMRKGGKSLKCVIGWLIPDSYFKENPWHVKDTSVDELESSVYYNKRMKPFRGRELLLWELQQAHDEFADVSSTNKEFIFNFLVEARKIAKDYRLKWNFK